MTLEKHFIAISPSKRKVGIVANNYDEFVLACKRKLNYNTDLTLKLQDGTEVDEDYFDVLESKTEILVNSEVDAILSPFFNKLHKFVSEYLAKDQLGLQSHLTKIIKSQDILSIFSYLGTIPFESETCFKTSRVEDPDWFNGLNTKFRTKEKVLANSAETRMRGYLYRVKQELETLEENHHALAVLDHFKDELKKVRYNASYFDRSADVGDRICSATGQFECEGIYNAAECASGHFINPYISREHRILFSTWNLDHVVEKSRVIIPQLLSLLNGPRATEINIHYFFNLLFCHKKNSKRKRKAAEKMDDDGNLKLVHIVCHDKSPHEERCDSSKVYNSPSKVRVSISPKKAKLQGLVSNGFGRERSLVSSIGQT